MCAGQEGGVEAAIHAMDELFHHDEVEAVLLVDASNAFNSLNRNSALHNMQYICPSLSIILRNTYQAPVRMFVPGGGEISSCEGTLREIPWVWQCTYALAITPLITKLHNLCDNAKQVWFVTMLLLQLNASI